MFTDLAYSGRLHSTIQCNVTKKIKKALKKSGYVIVNDESHADYLISVESLGCGRWGKIKKHIHTPKDFSKNLTKDIYSSNLQSGLSSASLGSTLASGGHSGAAGVSAAVGVLSVFGTSPRKEFKMFDAITIVNKKLKSAEQAIYYTDCHGNTFPKMLEYGKNQIANKFIMEIDW